MIPGNAAAAFGLGYAIALFAVQIGFAVAIYHDAAEQSENDQLKFSGPTLWMLATLIGGMLVVLVYWLIHHSSLRPQPVAEVDDTFKVNASIVEQLEWLGFRRERSGDDDNRDEGNNDSNSKPID